MADSENPADRLRATWLRRMNNRDDDDFGDRLRAAARTPVRLAGRLTVPPSVAGTSAMSLEQVERIIEMHAPTEAVARDAVADFAVPLFAALDVDTWSAIRATPDAMLEANTRLHVSRSEIRQAADYYINAVPWLRHPHLDWLVANALAYAETVATLHQWTPLYRSGGNVDLPFLALSSAWDLVKWGAALALIVCAFAFDLPWLGVLLIGGTIWRQVQRWRVQRARGRLLHAMLLAYGALTSSTLSWAVVWDHLAKARDLGAYWDPELYRLVELRMREA